MYDPLCIIGCLYSVMVGRMDGNLDMFDYAGKLCKEIKAHYKPISIMYYFSGYLVTGSFDGIVKVSTCNV